MREKKKQKEKENVPKMSADKTLQKREMKRIDWVLPRHHQIISLIIIMAPHKHSWSYRPSLTINQNHTIKWTFQKSKFPRS